MVLASRRERIYQRFPDPVSGYELDPEKGYFSVIIPEATTNLVTNPSVEGGVTTGWAAYGAGAAMAAIATWQAFGAYGLQLTPASAVESGCYWGTATLAVSTTYTASVTIQGEEGKKYYIWFASNAGALIGTKRLWIGTGHKQRIWVTHTETTGAARRVYITRDVQYTDTNLFYADGLQVEAKSYPTTYCDGDQVGFLVNEVPAPYLWTGTRRASSSTRSAQTRSGGREVSLLSLGLHVLAVLGLGLSPLVDQALPMPGRGELAQGTGTMAREFTLVSALYADGPGPRHLQALRSGLIDAFKPDLVTVDQPMILRYQACDDEGDPLGESLDIVCKYQSGLEGNWDNHQQERLPITFKMHLPLIQNTYDSGAALGYQTTVADADYVAKRIDGTWSNISTDFNGVVNVIVKGLDGSIYIGGGFTNVGDANGDYIVKVSSTGAISSLGTGMNGGVNALAVAPNGDIYAGGLFTLAGGVANTVKIAYWNGTAWNPLLNGITGAGAVYALAFDKAGNLYVGGTFTNQGDANGDYIVRWDGAAWTSLGTGANGTVRALAFSNNILYVGGLFAAAGGVAGASLIAQWNGVTWAPLRTGGTGNAVYSIAIGPDNSLYAGGDFTLMDSVPNTSNIAKWNGTTWSALDIGADDIIFTLWVTSNNILYAGGQFTTIGNITPPDRLAAWNGSLWMPIDINLPGVTIVYSIFSDISDNLYIGYDTAGSAISATVTVPTVGSATAYPIVTFTGPGTVYQLKNYTTGKAIYFDLILLAGETAILNLNPINPSFVSSFRGDIWNDAILPGSNLVFLLLPGVNNISSYIFGGTTAATAITMTWRPQYWSLDGAAWK